MVRIAIAISTLILLAVAAPPAVAQQSPGPRLDPNQLEKNFEEYRRERERSEKPVVRVPSLARPQPSASTKPLTKLTAVIVEGVRVISREKIAEVYQPYIGRTVSEGDLAEIARNISDLYRDAGFHLSRAIVPPQDIKNGMVRIRVIEGKIIDVVLKGDSAYLRARQLLQTVVAEQPARFQTLERQLLLVNDTPGLRIRDTALEEIGEASGEFRLIVDVETWRIYSALGVDNWGVSAIGPLQSQFITTLNSYFAPGDALGFNLVTVPDAPRELTFGQLWYQVPVGLSGSRVNISAAYGEIWPSDERRFTRTRTLSESVEARFSSVPLRTRTSSLWLTAGAGCANIAEIENDGALYNDHVRALSLSADYQMQDASGAWNYLTFTLRQGLDIFDASKRGDPFLSRTDGNGTFSKFEFVASRLQKLNDVWSVRLATVGQLASTALLASQEFNLGGQLFGRGYETAEISGDSGIAGSVEIRFDQKLSGEILKGFQLYGFLDGGAARDFRGGRDSVASLSSAGGGVRFLFGSEIHADIGAALPLSYRSPSNADRSPRVFFVLSKAFKFCPERFQMRCS